MESIPTILMLPPGGQSPAEQFVAHGKLSAALDLLDRLTHAGGYDPIYFLAGDSNQLEQLAARGAQPIAEEITPFHFGRALIGLITKLNLDRVAYFGGASAPLVTEQDLLQVAQEIAGASEPTAITNNFHSTDWALISHAKELRRSSDRLPTDNALGWILRNDLDFEVTDLPPSAATRLDIDTPSDIYLAAAHPNAGTELQELVASTQGEWVDRLRAMRQVLKQPGNTLTVIGRSSSQAWRELERSTQIWVRMFVEERGMTASGRLGRGEVCSLLGELLEQIGAEQFVKRLSESCSGVLWDTRVWMAMKASWPNANDRFAADLGWPDQVEDPRIRELTRAVQAAQIPILTGGQGLVSGGIYALLESLKT